MEIDEDSNVTLLGTVGKESQEARLETLGSRYLISRYCPEISYLWPVLKHDEEKQKQFILTLLSRIPLP